MKKKCPRCGVTREPSCLCEKTPFAGQVVRVTYASSKECGSNQMVNPYDDLSIVIEGRVSLVATWIDEHIIAGKAALRGEHYTQGAYTGMITEALLNEKILDLDTGCLKIKRLSYRRERTRSLFGYLAKPL